MTESNKTTVFDYSGNPKNAALFFDYVIPIRLRIDKSRKSMGFTAGITKEMIPIFPLQMRKQGFEKAYNQLIACLVLNGLKGDSVMPPDSAAIFKNDIIKSGLKFYEDLGCYFNDYNINYYEILHNSNNDSSCTKSYNTTSLELAQIPLIDTSKSEWEQIIKFREDKESVNKLRRLKLFFHQNYSGKEKNYVQDDLSQRLDGYANTVKNWGFETVTSSITLLSTSASVIGSSLVLALTGQPLEVAAASGLCVGISNMSLHIAKEKKKLSVLQKDHPLAYIIGAKKKLE